MKRFFLEFLFPVFCLCCGKEGGFVCKRCFMHIPQQREQVCPACYAKSAGGIFCDSCRAANGGWALDGVLTACSYEGDTALIARLIHAFKYEFSRDLEAPLGGLLAQVWEENKMVVEGGLMKNIDGGVGNVRGVVGNVRDAGSENGGAASNVVLCPVPLHGTRLRWRGYNQAALLARRASQQTGLPVVQYLSRVHFKKPQKELGREERLKNVEGAFICKLRFGQSPHLRARAVHSPVGAGCYGANSNGTRQRERLGAMSGKNVAGKETTILLVDDVSTTLATLEACAKALKEAGFLRVYGLVLARAY